MVIDATANDGNYAVMPVLVIMLCHWYHISWNVSHTMIIYIGHISELGRCLSTDGLLCFPSFRIIYTQRCIVCSTRNNIYTMFHTYALHDICIRGIFLSCICQYVPNTTHYQETCEQDHTHTFQTISCYCNILLNKYGFHIAYIDHNSLILYEVKDPSWYLQQLLHRLLPYVWQKQICHPHCTHNPYIWVAYMGDVCGYMCHI